eukprot:1742349-Rhodomonas_salina.1
MAWINPPRSADSPTLTRMQMPAMDHDPRSDSAQATRRRVAELVVAEPACISPTWGKGSRERAVAVTLSPYSQQFSSALPGLQHSNTSAFAVGFGGLLDSSAVGDGSFSTQSSDPVVSSESLPQALTTTRVDNCNKIQYQVKLLCMSVLETLTGRKRGIDRSVFFQKRDTQVTWCGVWLAQMLVTAVGEGHVMQPSPLHCAAQGQGGPECA